MWRWSIGALVAICLAIGGWTANKAAVATPRDTFDKHVEKADEKFDRMQQTIDDKVQKIYDHLLGEDE
jgi:hypothetical protein